MKRRIRFMLLTKHSDNELTDFLQREEDKGWNLISNKGNLFFFRKSNGPGRRVAAYSFLSRSPDTSTEIELRKELPYLRKNGWDMIAISGPEDIADSRRHAFLYEEKPGSEIPAAEDIAADKAEKRKVRKIISNLLLDLLYVAFIAFLFLSDLARITSDSLYLILSSLISILFAVSLFFSVKALISYLKSRRDKEKEIRRKGYRNLDRSTLITFITLLLILFFLISDYMWSGQKDRGRKEVFNGKNITVYSDEIPVTLKSLGLGASYDVKSSRHYEKKSFIASYTYSYEQHFGSSAPRESFISYAVYRTPYSRLRDAVAREMMASPGRADAELALAAGLDTVIRSNDGCRILARKGDSVIVIRSLIQLSPEAVAAIAEKLF